jgi:FAD/FMN-containing dehydrogenase
MMIFLQKFNKVTLDQSTGVATVGGGVRLGNMANEIYEQGKRALPHGTCPGVGVGGHATHGGYGHVSREYGLALDTIVAIDIVLANGTLVHATKDSSSEIFWACRGACESFGIVTQFYMQTHAAPDSITYFSIQYVCPSFALRSAPFPSLLLMTLVGIPAKSTLTRLPT